MYVCVYIYIYIYIYLDAYVYISKPNSPKSLSKSQHLSTGNPSVRLATWHFLRRMRYEYQGGYPLSASYSSRSP